MNREPGDQWLRILSFGTGAETHIHLVEKLPDGGESAQLLRCVTGLDISMTRSGGSVRLTFKDSEVFFELPGPMGGSIDDLVASEVAERLRQDKVG